MERTEAEMDRREIIERKRAVGEIQRQRQSEKLRKKGKKDGRKEQYTTKE